MKLGLSEASQLLQVSERTIRRWIESLDMPFVQEGSEPSFERAELIEWADRHSFRLAMDVPGEEDAAMPELAPALELGGVHHGVPGTGVDDALQETCARVHLPERVDRHFLHQVLLAREDLGSTGIGEGVAIPHVRSPLVLHIESPIVGLVTLARPVDWAAIDGRPVTTLFLLVSPAVRPHLHLLSAIAFALRDAELSSALARRAGADEIVARARELDARRPG